MRQVFVTLFARSFALLLASRAVVVGFLLGILILALAVPLVVGEMAADGAVTAASLRTEAWSGISVAYTGLVMAFAVALGSGALPTDAARGTLFAILARPVSRSAVFIASWSAAATFLFSLETMRCLSVLLSEVICGGRPDASEGIGMLALVSGECLVLALFSALTAAWPVGYGVLVGAIVLLLPAFAFDPQRSGFGSDVLNGIASLMPLVTKQSGVVRDALVGSAKSSRQVTEVLVYRLAWIVSLLLAGACAFHRREVAPKT